MDEALRADIRLLTTLLGQAFVRSQGPELFDKVDEELRTMDLPTTIKVVRAFTA